MSKTLVANPVAGLQGMPARITLDTDSMIIKEGIFGSKTFPYRSIHSVSFTGMNSLTLSGTIVITPLKGADIKLLGFYKKQFKLVEQAVSDGYFEDSEDDDSEEDKPNFLSLGKENPEVEKARIEAEERERIRVEEAEEKEEERKRGVISQIVEFPIETKDSDVMVQNLNYFIGLVESNEGEIRKVALAKYKTQLEFLTSTEPNHPMLKMYHSKFKMSKKKKGCLFAVIIGILFLILFFMIF